MACEGDSIREPPIGNTSAHTALYYNGIYFLGPAVCIFKLKGPWFPGFSRQNFHIPVCFLNAKKSGYSRKKFKLARSQPGSGRADSLKE